MCHSPIHASSVTLVLNTQTGNITPQLHCIYDDKILICKKDTKLKPLWQHKFSVNLKRRNSSAVTHLLPTVSHSNKLRLPNVEKIPLPPHFDNTWLEPPITNVQDYENIGTPTEVPELVETEEPIHPPEIIHL